jgi:superfamily II DNA/RNA helicase
MFHQIQQIRRTPHVIIGTPGRLKDLERQKVLSFTGYKTIVLDEVDRMLDMGFITDVTYITSRLPHKRQSLFFSATMPDEARGIMQQFLTNPEIISVAKSSPSANVDQDIVKLNGRSKIDVLDELLRTDGFDKVLVFGRTKYGMDKLQRALHAKGVSVAAIHGNKRQTQRQRAIDDFKQNRIQVLLATDIASRGLDIDQVTHVINYDQPESYEDYIHRIGRTGRANNTGIALTFVD